jgi:hypothetical protein
MDVVTIFTPWCCGESTIRILDSTENAGDPPGNSKEITNIEQIDLIVAK